MSVKIRLKRIGSKKRPFYRMVVADERAPRDGKYIEALGYYDPITKDLKLDNEKAQSWIGNGAQPTDTARALLKKSGAIN
ncbi:MAG: 30S ribosomal protein S16 [Christensenella sp.]